MKFHLHGLVFLILTAGLTNLHAMELQPLSEEEMAKYRGQMGFSAALVPALTAGFGTGRLSGRDAFFSADISGDVSRHTDGTLSREGDTLIFDNYTVHTPAKSYARVRPAGFENGPDFGTLHMGERTVSVSGYIRISHRP